ncbi:hypothetical protein DV737_g716, partial [Chaetothyriales sp. CBS 132003]
MARAYRNTALAGNSKPLMIACIGVSITPLTGLNAGYSLYQDDSKSFEVTGIQTYFANVSESPTWTTPEWRLEYDSRDTYGVAAASANGRTTWSAHAPLNPAFWHATKAADDDLLAQLEDLGAQAKKASSKPVSARPSRKGQPSQTSQTEQDLLAELGSLAQRPASRPATPSLKANPATATNRSPARTSTATPPSGASEDRSQTVAARKSSESTRSGGHQAFTPATTTTEESLEHPEAAPAPAKSGGWWGGFTSIATAAVSQVQKAAAEIQKSEDAQKYFEQVRGNVANLRGLSMSINAVSGVREGSKLARASAESYAHEHFAPRGGVEEAAKQVTESLSESNPTRDSEIFLALQAIRKTVEKGIFEGNATEVNEGAVQERKDGKENEEIIFAIYLDDPVHGIALSSLSSAVPAQWLEWLDAPTVGEATLPESIEEIIESGGVDPREWVSEWVEETIVLAVGVVAQRYVARRMGVGESGALKGKGVLRAGPENVVEAGGGEAARAMGGM